MQKANISSILSLLMNADAVAIFAGAGMGVDSGLEQYRNNSGIWEKTINLEGTYINQMELSTHQAYLNNTSYAWKFLRERITKFNETQPHLGYYELLNFVKNKEYFIITTNVDEQFQKAGFSEDRIFEIHGSVFDMQCTIPCEQEIWPTLLHESEIPVCPSCRNVARPNILLFNDWYWVSMKARAQQKAYKTWNEKFFLKYKTSIALEIGAGKTINTLRNASENLVKNIYPLIRVNPYDYEVFQSNHYSAPSRALEFLINLGGMYKR